MTPNTYTIDGFARHPALDAPDTHFGAPGFFAIGVSVAPHELERLRRACARLADPLAPGAATLPIRTELAGRPFVIARALRKPEVVIPARLQPHSIVRGDRVRVTGNLAPYRTASRHGVRLTLVSVELLAVDLRKAA
ncbi:hypothetical protein U8607_02535 [Methylobacterium durans]|uniref:hypothetical protein n=1 Tax=Methylobacterium durans TaxID=2202825 RepID=UPI002AFF67B3|nr:hypothetical protein [Methylobacterium durans]MEA1830948.1 hypothetical protein [Methylobacterium durans]